MEWSIQQIARIAGTTSRTLRHYDDLGIVPPSRIGANGYRFYDRAALVRLQRVLLLRELGLGLPAIARILAREADAPAALTAHLGLLRAEQQRLDRQIAALERTITSLEKGEEIMAESMFDGFDHTQFKDEVEQRWGADAYARSDAWWRGMPAGERLQWRADLARLNEDWAAAAGRGIDPGSDEAQALAARHVAWLRGVPGTPAADPGGDVAGYVRGLAQMYVADERFAANFGGRAGARFVRDALVQFVDEPRAAV